MSHGADNQVLAELDRLAPEILGTGRVMRLAGRVGELTRLDFTGHPWARLLMACATRAADPLDQRVVVFLEEALREFRRIRDGHGEAYACFLLGCRALEHGDVGGAARWWDGAREAAGPAPPGLEIMLAHRCLAAYVDGRLLEAVALSEEAVALARLRGQVRAEATALVNLAFMRLWTGDFALATEALDEAEDGFCAIPDPSDRFEWPLCFSARGVLCALRGQPAAAERAFGTAVDLSRQLKAGWYEGIARTLRAEFTAASQPRRARQDARWAIDELERRGDRWWSVWAAQAAGVAALAADMPDAAETVLREVLTRQQWVLESARTRLLLGETLIREGRPAEAADELRQAAEVFSAIGARYWAARCHVRLAATQEAGDAQVWWRRARDVAVDDPAYQKLFGGDSLRLTAFGAGEIICDGSPPRIRTHNTERAVFLLALAGPAGMHAEELADRLWSDDDADAKRLGGRLRTLLWEMRRVLRTQAWRLERAGPIIRLDTFGISFDLALARAEARTASGAAAADIAARLRGPLLTRWAYDDWVRDERLANDLLADRLDSAQAAGAALR